ncbi:MAG TPA: signal peptidase I [Gemmatimonadales bacterium]|nr:signal peptidase I [Gemmatimonadales bacterium]
MAATQPPQAPAQPEGVNPALKLTEPPSTGRYVVEWIKSIGVAFVIWFLVRTFLMEAFRIPSGSMENTLLVGDFLFVNKAVYGAEVPLIHKSLPAFREPKRGDVLVFDSVEQPGLKVVKRLIGVTGDTLSMEHGQLYRNGKLVEEPWAQHTDPTKSEDPVYRSKMRQWQIAHLVGRDPATYQPDLHDWGPIVVPKDSLFMMGDNRDNSYDGRYWGFLPRENVRGTPLIIYYSYDPDSWRPLSFLSAIRWNRFFTHPH